MKTGIVVLFVTVCVAMISASPAADPQRYGYGYYPERHHHHGGFNQGGFNQGGFNHGGFNRDPYQGYNNRYPHGNSRYGYRYRV